MLARLDPRSIAVRAGLLSRLTEVVSSAPSPLPLASGPDEPMMTVPPTYRLRRGELNARAEEVRPAFPAVLRKEVAGSTPVFLPTGLTTGRRRALADWLVQPSHPLTARVIVNRLWQQHFGRGIVASASDLGMAGEAPSHPALAARVTREAGIGYNDQLGRPYRLSLGRSPDDEERRLGLRFLEGCRLDDLMLRLFNANKVIYID
jgi:Protein of unknown function (DUF1553)